MLSNRCYLWQTNRYCLLREADWQVLLVTTNRCCLLREANWQVLLVTKWQVQPVPSQVVRWSPFQSLVRVGTFTSWWNTFPCGGSSTLGFYALQTTVEDWHAPGRLGSSKKQPWRRLQGTPGGWNPAKKLPGSCLRTSKLQCRVCQFIVKVSVPICTDFFLTKSVN